MTKKINLIVLAALLPYLLYCAMQLGPTWDVFFHYEFGLDRLNYLLSLGANEINTNIQVSKYYTGAYSTISAFFVQFFPRRYNLEAIYFFNSIFSTLAIFGIYKITKEFFNKQIGQITFLICFFNPIFFGHMAMNGMDTIIAFANIWCFYEIIRYLKYQQDNEKRRNYVICCGLFLGLGLGVRYSFLITLVPILLFTLIEIFYF